MRVLIAEDEEDLVEILSEGLRREGMAVDVALDGAAALELLAINAYKVLILDRYLPLVHGDDICRDLVAAGSQTRILMLTASGSTHDRVSGLTLGADDYLTKPFAFAELVARIRALARRAQPPIPPLLTHADLTLDPARRIVERAGQRVFLTPKEFAILETLLSARGAVVSNGDLLEQAWDAHADPFTNTVRVTMVRLRRKLGSPQLIETVTGAGYRMAEVI
ncbi:response regulator transcription factor [Streptomyces albipurpureus]|uniref:Response regulator transcription factor n=1 Tax=Streptomyces albipurpureus TaxID=2897419 RepID=A0ABT0UHQ6_9ACTN|nr:response regulator transcription factor [Streptomyces sp. CWNU-1]MCM2387978.1 response regulator transcription factor [Streptomyces sp. CWNU-1]